MNSYVSQVMKVLHAVRPVIEAINDAVDDCFDLYYSAVNIELSLSDTVWFSLSEIYEFLLPKPIRPSRAKQPYSASAKP